MIRFPSVPAPDVSVIMVTYGGWEWVETALLALAANTPPRYEVVIVDNASPDGTGVELERSVQGATIVRNDRNLGFGAGANQGGLSAVAPYLFFLNSDAFPQPGWLPPLVELLERDPRAGAVAPCLVEADGRLQEAGGLLGMHGVPTQYGLGGDIDDPQFRFRRRADFASGAALLVRRRDFIACGGFDPIYGMGYFEDVDLCLTLWERGLATVYEPQSRVVHLRGASTNFAESQRQSALSHPFFMRRWAPLAAQRPPLADFDRYPHRLVASRDARALDRVLVIEPRAAVHPLAEELAAACPDAHLTLLDVSPSAGDAGSVPVGNGRIEEAGPRYTWLALLRNRRFHYSMVVMRGLEAFHAGDDHLRRYQPQALRILALRPGEEEDDALEHALRSSTVIMVDSAEHRRRLQGLAPTTSFVVVPPTEDGGDPGPRRRALADVLIQLGISAGASP